jgi:hypothetical protein
MGLCCVLLGYFYLKDIRPYSSMWKKGCGKGHSSLIDKHLHTRHKRIAMASL